MPDRDPAPAPIPRYYQGCRLRSTLEGRWLVWLDALRVPWVYEVEGYPIRVDRERRGYLPDVFLPREDRFIEIKPALVPVEEALYEEFARLLRRDLLLVQGSPWPDEHEVTVYQPEGNVLRGLVWALGRTNHDELWLFRSHPEPFAYPLSGRVNGDHWPLADCEALRQAYRRARGYQFWTPR